MRIIIFKSVAVALGTFLPLLSQAEDLPLVKTGTVDGFYIGVTSSEFLTNNTSTGDRLNFGIWRIDPTNHYTVYLPTAHQYIYQISLLNSNGLELKKTKLGSEVGSHFMDFYASFQNDTGFQLTILHVMDFPNIGAQPLFFPYKSGFGGQPFYSPNDLFLIKDHGQYTLKIQFQFIVRTGVGHDKTAHVVRFPPLNYPLVKD